MSNDPFAQKFIFSASTVVAALVFAACNARAQDNQQQPYPPAPPQTQPYPPQQQQPYPPAQQQQYPPQQYPQQQQQYPPQQYPPQQQPYPPQAGQYPQQAPLLPPEQLDQIVAPIALYPDPLLAQVLAGATFSTEIPDAAGWATQHSYVTGPALAQAIQEDHLPFDAAVQALLPFPQVLDYMARNLYWTQQLGNAVLAQRPAVMDAVQRRRQQAYQYGYLRSNQYERVEAPAPYDVEIAPVNPDLYYVPVYDPYIIYARPRPGFFIGGAIHFGPAIAIGAPFAPWGWGGIGFGWRDHAILVGGRPWERSWINRREYVAPYPIRGGRYEGPRVERHEVRHYDEHGRDDHHH